MRRLRTVGLGVLAAASLMLSACGQQPSAQKPVRQPRKPAVHARVVHQASITVTASQQEQLPGSLPSGMDLTGVAMANADVGWASATGMMAAEATYALKTTDGGRSFTQIFAAPERIVGVAAPDAQDAFFLESECLAGCSARLQAVLGGSSSPKTLWQAQGVAAAALSFPTAQVGFISIVKSLQGTQGTAQLLSTRDGGQTWTISALPCAGDPYTGALDFLDANNGFLVCEGQPVYHGPQEKSLYVTTDGGAHWSLVAATGGVAGTSLPAAGYTRSLYFTSSQTGYMALGGGGFYRTQDGGKTWTPVFSQEAPAGSEALAVGMLPGSSGWVLTGPQPALSVTKDVGQTWNQVYPGLDPTWVSDLGGGRAIGFSVFGPPKILASSDGGASWSAVSNLPFTPIALQAPSASDLVAATETAIEESRDGGQQWTAISLPSGWTPVGIGFDSSDQGWLVAMDKIQSNALFACGEGGCKNLQAPFYPLAADATGPASGIAVGLDANDAKPALFATSDGGAHWTERLLPGDFNMGGNDYVTVGERGETEWVCSEFALLQSVDGGRSWHEVTFPVETFLSSLSFESGAQGLLTADSPGTATGVYRTQDGGRSFKLVYAP